MFTGIINEVGTLRGIRRGANSAVLTIGASTVLEDVHLGDSIAVNGVCLTVVDINVQQLGIQAASLLYLQLQSETPMNQQSLLPVRLIQRSSSR